MSDKRTSDDQIQGTLSEAEGGLRPPGEDAPDRARTRSGPRGGKGPSRSSQGQRELVVRWLAPGAAVVLVILVVGILLYLSQGGRITTLESEVDALRGRGDVQGALDGLRTDLRQLEARVEGLTTQINVKGNGGRTQARQQLKDQKTQIEALSGRVAELEKALGPSRNQSQAAQDNSSATPGAGQSARTASGGGWVVNLVAVADAGSAEQIQKQLKDMGIEPRIDRIKAGGASLQRVVATGFGSYDEAKQFAARAKKKLGLSEDPWVSRE